MKMLQAFALVAGALTAMAGVAAPAFAVPCVLSSPALVSTFTSCDLGNDTITKLVDAMPSTTQISFDLSTPGQFSVIIGFSSGFVGAGSSGSLTYSISSLGGLGLVQAAKLSGLGFGQTPNNATVTKTVVPGGVLSVSGANSQTIHFNDQAFLTVTDSFTVGPNALLFGFTNDFVLPEPATLAVFGVSLVGLGIARRRRRAA